MGPVPATILANLAALRIKGYLVSKKLSGIYLSKNPIMMAYLKSVTSMVAETISIPWSKNPLTMELEDLKGS